MVYIESVTIGHIRIFNEKTKYCKKVYQNVKDNVSNIQAPKADLDKLFKRRTKNKNWSKQGEDWHKEINYILKNFYMTFQVYEIESKHIIVLNVQGKKTTRGPEATSFT